MRNSSIMFLMALSLAVGCATPLTNLQRAEQAYQQSEAERKKEEEAAKAAQVKADEAARAEADAGKGLSTALVQDADERVKYVEQQLKQAEEQRKRACILNPQLDICKKAEPPTPQAQPAPPPVQAAEPPHVDIKVNEFSLAGLERLTDYPLGWKVTFDAGKGEVTLMIGGNRAYGYSKPANFKAGVCYRFEAKSAVLCPVVPPPAPAAATLPGP